MGAYPKVGEVWIKHARPALLKARATLNHRQQLALALTIELAPEQACWRRRPLTSAPPRIRSRRTGERDDRVRVPWRERHAMAKATREARARRRRTWQSDRRRRQSAAGSRRSKRLARARWPGGESDIASGYGRKTSRATMRWWRQGSECGQPSLTVLPPARREQGARGATQRRVSVRVLRRRAAQTSRRSRPPL